MSEKVSSYDQLGVSSSKPDVHAAVEAAGEDSPSLFPGAFCRVTEDVLGGDDRYCNAMSTDGSGSKINVSHIHHQETGDATWFKGNVVDCIEMNLGDLNCIGADDRFLLGNVINRNRKFVTPEVLKIMIGKYADVVKQLRGMGVNILAGGGETADLPNNVQTVVADATIVTRMKRSDVIDNSKIVPGDVIIGLSSAGQTTYEDKPNSGIGSNGLTLAQHKLLHKDYMDKYPETIDPTADKSNLYTGPFHLDDRPAVLEGMSIGEALSSPTRMYLPALRQVLALHRQDIHGIVHNTGGGLTKGLKFGNDIRYVKNKLQKAPPIFGLIAEQGVPHDEMPETFNLGYLMEIVAPHEISDSIISIMESFGIRADTIGMCERSNGKNKVTVNSPDFGSHTYPSK